MALSDTIREDLKFIENEMEDQFFTWKGNDYICIPNTANEEKKLEVGGFQIMADFVTSVRADQFSNALPQEQDLIRYLGRNYRIIRVGTIALGVYIRLHCMAEFRGV